MECRKKKQQIKTYNQEANDAIKKSVDSIASPKINLENTKAFKDWGNYIHPSFSIHHGLTDAQRAAKKAAEEAARYAQQITDLTNRHEQLAESIDKSVNRRWTNKNQPFSDLTSDAYDFEEAQSQINDQFDKMVDSVKTLAEHQHKSITSPEFVKQIAEINKMRGDALEDNLSGYNKYEDNLHSVLAGVKKGMKDYQETSDKVALQVAQVWDKSLDYMTDSLTDFFTTGEDDWKNYLTDILKMIEKILVRDVIVQPASNYIGGLLGVSTGGSTQAVDTVMSASSLPVPSVPNLSSSKSSGVGSSAFSGIQVIVNNNNGNVKGATQSDTKQGQDLGRTLQKAAQNWIKQQNVQSNKQGGVNRSMNSWSVK
ncbi:TPA: hypothetical protein MO340_002972 [Salmonella enterica subsp. salamae serovar 35:g,m,s,t:-]|nr:hypothetical protein [Salmonella enterica subsp. salamae serovar 35:g,m,s,t:-]HCA3417981.1 hypothetical protein [Salmonella enterica subsp. salamae serovar 35:g,m,s,t:-]HCA3427034.1 hypothetical protein [Salmonella enterica subsp. salamae serovar 35:g,m,s,t:-]HCA3436772.1 hypothetical protein [Salmonella enterica subsp. salamae serovar 35:g,m,s,t:-]HCA3440567.1 hypothetical protein [Salmonella enterica subsp. salamae serovar 35:g,m,s,t:-]